MTTNSGDNTNRTHEEYVSRETVYEGKVLRVYKDAVRLPSGTDGVREIVGHPGSVVIVPVTTDGEVVMIRQFRYAAGETLRELPAGLIDPGEAPEQTAVRELMEETGYQAGSMRWLASVYLSPGYSQEMSHIFLAEGCTATDHAPDDDEPMSIELIPLTEVPGLLTPGGDVRNAQAMIGLLWLIRLGIV